MNLMVRVTNGPNNQPLAAQGLGPSPIRFEKKVVIRRVRPLCLQ